MDYNQLGKRVRQQRILNKLTQEQLAEKAGISCAFVGHIERGEKKASLETLVALCNVLEVSPTEMLQDSLSKAVMERQLRELGEDKALVLSMIRMLREHKDGERPAYDE